METEETKKSQNIIKKKRIITVFLIILLVLILVLCFIFGTFIYKIIKKKYEPQNVNMNTLYGEEVNHEEEEDVLRVELPDENDKKDENENNQNTRNNQVNTNVGTNTNQTTKPVSSPYYIKVNYEANVVTVYKKDSKGKYTVPIKAMICSCGTATPTAGVYGITDKYTWRLLEGNVYGQYACRITGSILFHSVPYEKKDKSTLEWWEYDKLGKTASLGCVRLKVEDAKWIYNNCIPGTKVEFYKDGTPGPLGKPTAKKITQDQEVRNWDPTDPDPANPWSNYLKSQGTNKEQDNNITNNNPSTNKNTTNNNTNMQENINTSKDNNLQNNIQNNEYKNDINTKNETFNILEEDLFS